MKLPRIRLGRPQLVAGLILLVLLGECLLVIHHQQLTEQDYSYARCGREIWERPSFVPGYFTTCGNLSDGTFAYRVAGLPIVAERLVLGAIDRTRPEDARTGVGNANATEWELRHQVRNVLLLEHLAFTAFALWLGAGLWWVSRRLFGNEGGALALGFYCLSPAVIRMATVPNNDLLAAWGIYGTVYTAIGVAHAMQGPRRKWRPRIVLLALALGLTACAHLLAAIVGLVVSLVLMLWVAERNREDVLQVLAMAMGGATLVVFASYDFSISAASYLFRGGAARFWASWQPAANGLLEIISAPMLMAVLLALLLFLVTRRSRYFGNAVPLLVSLLLLPLLPTEVQSQAWFWAVPFVLTFMGGVWADALETRQRRAFLAMAIALIAAQALITGTWLARG